MEIVCINGKFPADFVAYYIQYGVRMPKQDVEYTIRDVVRNTDGSTGLLLVELENPRIPIIGHPILGSVNMEPNWNIERFAHANNDKALDYNELREYFRKQSMVKIKKLEAA